MGKMPEKDYLYDTYLKEKDSKSYFSIIPIGISSKEASELFKDWRVFDRPDIFTKSKSAVHGIEHFEYDAYEKSNRGSVCRRELNNLGKEFSKITKEALQLKDSCTMKRAMQNEASLENLCNNFINIYNNHSDKIKEYKTNLIKETSMSNIRIWFVAEDTTPLGSRFFNKNRGRLMSFYPPFDSNVARILINNKQLDGLIFTSKDCDGRIFNVVKNSKAAFDKFRNIYGYGTGDEIYFFSPNITSFAEKIKNYATNGAIYQIW